MTAKREDCTRMAIEVAKVELKTVQDASGVEACISNGQFTADQVIAVIGKTEGNGGVNDFTRILADQAFRRVLIKHGSRSEAGDRDKSRWSGRAAATASSRRMRRCLPATTRPARQSKSRLAIGTAMSAELLPEDIGRPAMVEKVADGVKAAMRDAGIDDPADVHYVQTKTPLLTIESVQRSANRAARRSPAKCTIPWACRTAPPGSALRWRSARSQCRRPRRSATTSISIRRSPRARPASS